jgi:hypothetical protein
MESIFRLSTISKETIEGNANLQCTYGYLGFHVCYTILDSHPQDNPIPHVGHHWFPAYSSLKGEHLNLAESSYFVNLSCSANTSCS